MALASGPARRDVTGDIPYGVRIAAAWSWRIAIIVGCTGLLLWLLSYVSLLVIPLMIAALLAGLLRPVVVLLRRWQLPNGLATGLTMLAFLAVILGLLLLVGRTMARGMMSLWQQALTGISQVQHWLSTGPLHLTNQDVDRYVDGVLTQLQSNSDTILSGAVSWGSTLGHFAAGLLLALFSLVFFLLEGERIWAFVVRLMPRRARAATDGAGRRGWVSLVNYVRVQLFVAFIDAVGIGVGAAILGVPLAFPLAGLVFLGSFIPVIGALVTGALAVLLALVANGWVNALIMLAVVLLVQQAESHILQPLVMGRAVSLHPLAVVLAVAGGSLIAGIAGALFAVPVMAVLNTMVRYISARGWETPDAAATDGDPPPGLATALTAPADLDGETDAVPPTRPHPGEPPL
ncbi:AI-2E family transporter [Arthrobacter sp. JSM 101049]|uniref:AI-2E family transporter n=1 Tax=Arthrobacter sp. JSM 101049 TaxID=929097 RepID=UPI0035651855